LGVQRLFSPVRQPDHSLNRDGEDQVQTVLNRQHVNPARTRCGGTVPHLELQRAIIAAVCSPRFLASMYWRDEEILPADSAVGADNPFISLSAS